MKKILITGLNSYIGTSFESYINNNFKDYSIFTLDTKNENWQNFDFENFDAVFNVAGIAHECNKKSEKDIYYKVNRDLAIAIALKAKKDGVKQYIYMSSILIYNGIKEKTIDNNTTPKGKGYYADSKYQADLALQKMQTENFNVVILRPPMVFGLNSKGNFPKLLKLANKIPIFPKLNNKRSMIYIENLCEFIKLTIDNNVSGIFYPQNPDYFCTSDIIKTVAIEKSKRIIFTKLFNFIIYCLRPINKNFSKMFGNLTYDKNISNTFDYKYQIVNNEESIKRSISV